VTYADITLSSRHTGALAGLVPGLLLVTVVTGSAYGLRSLPFLTSLSPMIIAIFLGMMVANVVGIQKSAEPGIALAGKKLLRLAVALLGLQLTVSQMSAIGLSGIAMAVAVVVSTLLVTVWMGRMLGVERKLTLLLAAGTAICGASAIAGANAVTRARDEDVAYAVACITLFGTIAMFLFPFLSALVGNDPDSYGLWVGLTVQEVAQVVGAGFQGGDVAGEIAVVSKFARIMLLAPVVIGLALFVMRSKDASEPQPALRQAVPIFILGFLALVVVNSVGILPDQIRDPVVAATPVLLTAAMAALGLGTSFDKLRQHGVRPLLLACLASIYVAVFGLLLVKLAA
jgi:uncharacterized integral membrane protein (TIGR00698 family)